MRSEAPQRRLHAKPGTTLIETIGVLTLTSLVAALIVGTCVAQMRLARVTAERATTTDAVRTVTSVLSGEARRMTREDVIATGRDSIQVRAFRGTGIPCGATPIGMLVRYSGDRMPDPAKDSVLPAAGPDASAVAMLDSGAAAGTCVALPGEVVLEWRLDAAVPLPSMLLVFETGSYHLAERAFRYRAGAAGRQPLTPEVLRQPSTRFTGVDTGAIRFEIDAGGHLGTYAAPFTANAGRR